MQKVVIRKLQLTSSDVIRTESDCEPVERLIQQEIDNGWKVVNISSSYDVGWHCNVIVFVLEKNVMECS